MGIWVNWSVDSYFLINLDSYVKIATSSKKKKKKNVAASLEVVLWKIKLEITYDQCQAELVIQTMGFIEK